MSNTNFNHDDRSTEIINRLIDEIKSLRAEISILKGEITVLERSRDFHQTESSARQNVIAFLNKKVKELEKG